METRLFFMNNFTEQKTLVMGKLKRALLPSKEW